MLIKKNLIKLLKVSVFFLSLEIIAQDINNASEINSFSDNINEQLQDNITVIASEHNYNLDPHTSSYNSEAQILTGLCEGLFSYNPVTLEPQFAIASDYKISRDKKRWTFTIRNDAKFSDGTPITAKNIKDSWLALLSEPNAPYASLFYIINGAKEFHSKNDSIENVGIKVIDDLNISLYLNAPASHLPKLLCMNAFSVKNPNPFVSSGPFYIAEQTNEFLILKKNEYYYDSVNTKLKQITYIFSDDSEENTHAFNTGLADWVSGPADIKKLISKDSTHISAEYATEYLFFKETPNSIWNNVDFRLALLEAIPWDKLRENTFVKATTLVYPLNGYPAVEGFSYTDKIEAKKMMDAARQKLNIPQDQIIPITFAITDSEYMQKKATLLKDAWQDLGVDLSIITVNSYEYLHKIQEINADLFSYTWIGDFADPLAFLELFRSNSTLNVTNWKNSEFDKLLDEAALYSDENHSKILAQAEQLLLNQGLIIPIQHPVSLNIIDLNSIGGWSVNSFDIHPLKYLFKKEQKINLPNVVLNY